MTIRPSAVFWVRVGQMSALGWRPLLTTREPYWEQTDTKKFGCTYSSIIYPSARASGTV